MQKRIFRSKSTIYHLSPANNGFTIIELIVVVAILAILSAIFMVNYNASIQNSINSSLQSGLKNASKQLNVDQIRSSTGVFPATLAAANSGGGISFSPSTTVAYTVDNTDTPKVFCLSATQSSQSYFITQEATPLPGPCPVLYLDAGIQNSYPGTGTAWNDLSGLRNNGVMCNCTSYSNINGGYLIFNGTSSSVNIPDNNSLDFGTGSFTVEIWLNFSAYGSDYRNLVYKGASSGVSGWRFGMTTTGIPHYLIGDTTSYKEGDLGTTPVSLNTWHELAIVYNRSSNAVGYIDGVKMGTSSISVRNGVINNSSPVLIGYGTGAMAWYNGKLGIVSIRSAALSDTDIKNSFNALRSRYGV